MQFNNKREKHDSCSLVQSVFPIENKVDSKEVRNAVFSFLRYKEKFMLAQESSIVLAPSKNSKPQHQLKNSVQRSSSAVIVDGKSAVSAIYLS